MIKNSMGNNSEDYRLSWDDLLLSEQLKGAMKFDAYFFRQEEVRLRKEREKNLYRARKTLENIKYP